MSSTLRKYLVLGIITRIADKEFSRSGPNTLAAYKNASMNAQRNVSPTSVAGTGGNLTESGNSTSANGTGPNAPSSTGGATHVAGSAAFAGLAGIFAYLLI